MPAAAIADLQRDGFVMLDGLIPTDLLRTVRSRLEEHACFDGWRPEKGTFAVADAPADSNNVHIQDVELIPEVIAIANHPIVLGMVGRYLGCQPTIDDILAWWSLPGRPVPREEQLFHRDQDSIRFLKLFIYLSDVGESDGPHVFVRGSHQSNVLLDPGKRFSDEEVVAATNGDDTHRFVGNFGTTFLEDTFGLHKGSMPELGTRLILQVRYTMLPSVFARPGEKKGRVEGYDAYVNRLIADPLPAR